ncbi:MAG: hypothetical protein M1482_09680 [Chloroflexi bacterium]|nr:hypothetical protein [Chloroflexota bacterium]
MCDHRSQPQNTFVIRFWLEPAAETPSMTGEDGPPAAPRWHARIQHLQSDTASYIADERQLLAFIKRYVAQFESPEGEPSPEEEDK